MKRTWKKIVSLALALTMVGSLLNVAALAVPGAEDHAIPNCEGTFVAGTTVVPTCGADGYIPYHCATCGERVNSDIVPATGEHTYESGICSVCGAPERGNLDPLPGPLVASVGGTDYSSLEDALTDPYASTSGITMWADEEVSVTLTQPVSINLNGFTLSGSGTTPIITIKYSAGTTSISNGTLTGGRGIVYEEDGFPLPDGADVAAVAQTISVSDVVFQNHTAETVAGGPVQNAAAVSIAVPSPDEGEWLSVSLTGCTFRDNAATYSTSVQDYNGGGAVYLRSIDNVSIQTCGFLRNSSGTVKGGALLLDSCRTMDISNCTFTENRANAGGGAVSITGRGDAGSRLAMAGNTFTDNVGGTSGGAVYLRSCYGTLTGGSMSGNSAANGGAVYIYMGTMTLSDVAMTGNRANSYGGAVYAFSNSYDNLSLTLNNVAMTGNSAREGGAIYNSHHHVAVNGGIIQNNTARSYGGGYSCSRESIPVYTASILTISDGTVVNNNTASSGGDDIHVNTGARNTVIIEPVIADYTLDGCDHAITGWYLDANDARWNGATAVNGVCIAGRDANHVEYVLPADGVITGPISLKAAHGFNDDTPDPFLPPDTNPTPPPEEPTTPPEEPSTPPEEPENIPQEEVPATEAPVVEEEIPQEEPPMAEAPETGDSISLWLIVAALSGMGLVAMAVTSFKRKENEV